MAQCMDGGCLLGPANYYLIGRQTARAVVSDVSASAHWIRGTTTPHSSPFPLCHRPTMSDSDGDFSDELLELAGATEKKRKRREGSSKSEAKRRKAVG